MKVIGLIGGMSWESTLLYYRTLNESVRDARGGQSSAKLLLYSVDFHEIEALQRAHDWKRLAEEMAGAAKRLEAGGADFIVLCTNTMHKVADAIERATRLPLLHIADPTGRAIRESGLRKVGLLGTRFTMQEPFYRRTLEERFNLEVVLPSPDDITLVDKIIYDELCLGIVKDESRQSYSRVIQSLVDKGAKAVILGCTEITLLVGKKDSPVPLFDTTALHAREAVRTSLSEQAYLDLTSAVSRA